MNIPAIVSSFQTNANFGIDNEVALFRELAKCICAHSNSIFIDETHGQVAQIEFDSKINGVSRCEISDLLLVVRESRTNQCRATFWQLKKELSPRWPAPRGISNFDFTAQFNQWELLSHRPDIRGLGQFQPHKALLSNAMSPSIGSFGVFYENRGVVEVNYSVAEMVTSSSVAAHPRMVINEMLGKYTAWQDEAMMRHDIASFLYAVSAFMVGSLINPAEASDRWLRDYVISRCNDKGITEFFDGDGDNGSTNLQTSDGDGISLLLVNIERNHTA